MIGILFTARLGSSRLPQKHLIKAGNRTFIEWLVMRFIKEFDIEIKNRNVKLIIATSDEPDNREFENVLTGYDVDVFYGAISNIPQRHLQCADHYKLQNIISIDGDDILCSPKGARIIYDAFTEYPQKNIINVSGLPIGMNSSGYQVSYLRHCLANTTQQKIETGWGRIFVDQNQIDIKIGEYDIYDKLRFTLDYDEDAIFFTTIIDTLKNETLNISDQKLIEFVEENKFDVINAHLFDTYWDNFNTLKQDEQNTGQ